MADEPEIKKTKAFNAKQLAAMAQADAATRRRACLMVIEGPMAGQTFVVGEQRVTLGRGEEAIWVLDDEEVSRLHAAVVVDKNGTAIIEDLGSTNGVYRNGQRVDTKSELNDGDTVRLGGSTILKFSYKSEDELALHQKQYESATKDLLTGAATRAALMAHIDRELSFSRRHARPLSILILDVDHFKRINDTFGHLAGDAVLRTLARAVGGSLRSSDFFGRYGGEEFVIVAREASATEAASCAERVRLLIEKLEISYDGNKIPVTISIGTATLQAGNRVAEVVLKAADACLYEAKEGGRNRVVGVVLSDPAP